MNLFNSFEFTIDSMDIDTSYAILATKIDMAYNQTRDALKRLREVEEDITSFERNMRLRTDKKMAKNHDKKTDELKEEIKAVRVELTREARPEPVCSIVYGLKDTEGSAVDREIVFVIYDNNDREKFIFEQGELYSAEDVNDERVFRKDYKEISGNKKRYRPMSSTEVSKYGITVGKPVDLVSK